MPLSNEVLEILKSFGNPVVQLIIDDLLEANKSIEQLRTQLTSCSLAASGTAITPEKCAKRGDYGWSVAYQDVLKLRRAYDSAISKKVKHRKT